MNINEASDFFESLETETDKNSEIKVYENFIGILSDLKNRNLTEEDLQSIEKELDILKLKENTINKKKYSRRKLTEFKKYLKDEFSFISEGYYTVLGISLGVAFGAAFGTIFEMNIGIAFGMIIGLLIGRYMDSEAEKQNRVLITKLK